MPRYYFHFVDGELEVDSVGIDLPDIDAARQHTLDFGIDALKRGEESWTGRRGWQILVLNEEGESVSQFKFSVGRYGGSPLGPNQIETGRA